MIESSPSQSGQGAAQDGLDTASLVTIRSARGEVQSEAGAWRLVILHTLVTRVTTAVLTVRAEVVLEVGAEVRLVVLLRFLPLLRE